LRRAFLKGITPSAFLDTSQEWHALVLGLCEVICPWPPRCHCERSEAISNEYHYYLFGRALGVIAWLVIGIIIKEVFF
jgi:hypothetical protein